MKNKSTLLKIRKNENFLYLGNTWRKKIHAKTFFFIRGIADKIFRKIIKKNGLGRQRVIGVDFLSMLL